MSCERYQRLMHLNRAGEISADEANKLRLHVKLCEQCALELHRIERADALLVHLNDYSPSPAHPEELTSTILRLVRAEVTTPVRANALDRILDLFFLPAVRYASVAIVLTVTATFMTQLVMTLNSISNLEQRMASHVLSEAAEPIYIMQSKTLQQVTASQRGKALKDNMSLTVVNDRIDVPVKNVDAVLAGYTLNSLPATVGAAALGVDRKTLDQIVNEIQTTVALTFRFRHEGA